MNIHTLLASRPRRRARSERALRHILASPGYTPGTIAVNVTWIEREFNACQTLRSMYPSIFNRFPVIHAVSLKVRHFSTFLAHFDLPWVRPWDNRDKFYMDGKRIQCWSNASQHVSIFNRLRDIARYWSEIATFFLPLAFNAPVGGVPIGIPGKSLDLRKLESWGYQTVFTVWQTVKIV